MATNREINYSYLNYNSMSDKRSLKIPKGVIRSYKSKKDRQCNGQKVEDTKRVIRRYKSRKTRQYNGQKKDDKQ